MQHLIVVAGLGLEQVEVDPQRDDVHPRRVDQASVDNAIALGGVKETNNLIVQFNDRSSNQEVWQVTLTEIVENTNDSDASRLNDQLTKFLQRALQPIPQSPGQ